MIGIDFLVYVLLTLGVGALAFLLFLAVRGGVFTRDPS